MSTYDTIIQMIRDDNNDAKDLIKRVFKKEHIATKQINSIIEETCHFFNVVAKATYSGFLKTESYVPIVDYSTTIINKPH